MPVPRCPVASCRPNLVFGRGWHECSGLAGELSCRHVSSFGSACPGGLPASAQPTAGAAVPSLVRTSRSVRHGALTRCLCSIPESSGRPCRLTCSTVLLLPLDAAGEALEGGPRQSSNGGHTRPSDSIGRRGLARARGCGRDAEGRGSVAPRPCSAKFWPPTNERCSARRHAFRSLSGGGPGGADVVEGVLPG